MKHLLLFTLRIVGLLLFSLSPSPGQTRMGLFATEEDRLIWRDRFDNGPYKNKGDVSANSIGDGKRVNDNANSFRSNPAADRYDSKVYKGSGYVPRDNGSTTYDPEGKAIGLRDCAFRSLVYRNHPNSTKAALSVADATAVITELKRIVDQPFSTTDSRKCFDWNDASRWGRIKPYNFQDNAPGFPIAEWLNRYLFAADMVRTEMSGPDSTKIYNWIRDAAYYMLHNFQEDADAIFTNRAAGNYHARPGFDYTRESDAADYRQLYSTSSAIGPKAHYLTRHYSNRRLGMVYFVGNAGIALNDPYLIGIAKQWMGEMLRFSINPQGDFVDLFRSITDKHAQKGPGYSHLSGYYAFADMLALYGDRSLYEQIETRGPETTSLSITGIDRWGDGTGKTLKSQILRLCDLRNHVSKVYASLTPTSDPTKLMDGSGSIIDGLFAIANRWCRDDYIKQTYLRTYVGTGGAGSVPYPATPDPSGSTVAASVLAQYPAVFLMFANMENVNDRYRQAETDPGGDTTSIPPPAPPPPIVSHWANFSDTITITAPTGFLNYVKENALDSATSSVSSRYVTNHSGNDTLSYLFPSARSIDSVALVTGRGRFTPAVSYRIEYLHAGTWTNLLDVANNTSISNYYNVNVAVSEGFRIIFRDADYTRVAWAGVKISAPF
jgi:hypothetical protein